MNSNAQPIKNPVVYDNASILPIQDVYCIAFQAVDLKLDMDDFFWWADLVEYCITDRSFGRTTKAI
jgi:hypothetical protein